MFEFRDAKIDENTFIRSILNNRYTFKDSILIKTEILVLDKWITIYDNNIHDFNPHYLENYWNNSNYKAELFIAFKLSLIILLALFIWLTNDYGLANSLAAISSYNTIKLRKVQSKYNWKNVTFKINNKVFSHKLFEKLFNQFWSKIDKNFTENNHMFILFKIKYITGQTLSIGKVQRLNNNDNKWYSDFLINFIDLKANFYKETQIESLIFSYGFKDGKIENKQELNYNGPYHNYNNYLIPNSIIPQNYGILFNEINMEDSVVYFLHNEKGLTIVIRKYKDFNLIKYLKNGKVLLEFRDEIISENKFSRIIGNNKFYFENGEQILLSSELKTKFISKTSKSKNLVNNFITIDIETYITDGLITPYLICFYDGKNFFSFYLSDYNSVEEMMLDCLNSILIRKYKGYSVYAHNLAKFDIIFLLKYLVKVGNIHPIIHNGKIISLTLKYGENGKYKIEFKDSLLLLLTSLNSLCNSFKIKNPKSIFPHLFVNENNLDYNGEVPNINNFIKINKEEYQNYKSNYNNWSLKTEAIKYCKIDCISLYQILFKFNNMIFDLFGKNIHHYPTLSSLAFAIYRSNFMKENKIPQISGKIAKDIKEGYTGGAVDMYIPEGSNIKAYDVNSLYPSQMQSQDMPVGMPNYFNGNILKIDANAFGFFYCKITAPDDIKHPILQTRIKVNGIHKTIAPIGSWEDMLFSEEMKNALKYGYKIEVLWGYTFESENIFKDYVEFLYNLRSQYPSTDPMNFIAKILLNSLYGRFGMDDNFDNIKLIHKDFYSDFENKFIDQITEKIELDNYWIVFFRTSDNLDEDQREHNVSVGIASAITAYSRIHMTQFKNNPNINLYYTDTDSIYTDSDIDESFINKKILGKLKLEHILYLNYLYIFIYLL